MLAIALAYLWLCFLGSVANSQPNITTSLNLTYDGLAYLLHGNDTSLPLEIRTSPKVQTAEGYTFDEFGDPLSGVDVICEDTGARTTSNETGYFYIEAGYFPSDRIIFHKEGFEKIELFYYEFDGEVFLKEK